MDIITEALKATLIGIIATLLLTFFGTETEALIQEDFSELIPEITEAIGTVNEAELKDTIETSYYFIKDTVDYTTSFYTQTAQKWR